MNVYIDFSTDQTFQPPPYGQAYEPEGTQYFDASVASLYS